MLGDAFDDERRAGYVRGFARDAWRALKAAQSFADYGEPVERLSRAAEIVAEFEADAIYSERRGAADTSYLRPFGGGEAYDREMAKDALCLHVMADQGPWGAEAIAAFLPIAKEARGGKDDDPALDNHIDCLAQTFVWKFIHAKIAAAEAEAEAEIEAKSTAKPKASRKAASSHPLDGVTLGKGVDWTRPGGLLSDIVDWIMATSQSPNRPLAVAAAVATLAPVAGWAKLHAPTGCTLNPYIIMLGRTAIGKDRALKAVGQLLTAAGLVTLHVSNDTYSIAGLETILVDRPAMVMPIDEIAKSMMPRMMGRKSSSHETAMQSFLMKLWSRNMETRHTPRRDGRRNRKFSTRTSSPPNSPCWARTFPKGSMRRFSPMGSTADS